MKEGFTFKYASIIFWWGASKNFGGGGKQKRAECFTAIDIHETFLQFLSKILALRAFIENVFHDSVPRLASPKTFR